MDQINNSPIKETIRQQNERDARDIEFQIRKKLDSDIAKLTPKGKFSGGACVGFAVAFGFVGVALGFDTDGFLGGLLVGAIFYLLLNEWSKSRKKSMQEQAEKDIRNAYAEADSRTVQQINAYDNEVKQYCQRILQKSDTIAPMVQHNVDMFQRMVSHADAGSNMRFVESDFTFTVFVTGIMYSYQSHYTNPQDDFNFDKQRFRNLNKDAECEGLAQALAKLTVKKMTSLYPPNSLHITVSHIDAQVTMHYKAANKNFIAARDIL